MKNLETPGKTGRVGRYAYGTYWGCCTETAHQIRDHVKQKSCIFMQIKKKCINILMHPRMQCTDLNYSHNLLFCCLGDMQKK